MLSNSLLAKTITIKENMISKFMSNMNCNSLHFSIKINKLNEDNSYEKIEFDFENNCILIQDSKEIMMIKFPEEMKNYNNLESQYFSWNTSKSFLIIKYKPPPPIILIDDNVPLDLTQITKPIVIEDARKIKLNPKTSQINVITDFNEIKDKINFDNTNRKSKAYREKRKKVIENIEKEWPTTIALKPKQYKILADLLIEKNFDSYDDANKIGLQFDISNNTLTEANNENDEHLDLVRYQEDKYVDDIDQIVNELEESPSHKKIQKEKKNEEMRKRKNLYELQKKIGEKKNIKNQKNFEKENRFELKKKRENFFTNQIQFQNIVASKNNLKNQEKNFHSLKRKRKLINSDEEECLF